MTPLDIHFMRPLWLLMLIPLAVLLWRLRRSVDGAEAWRRVVDAHLLPRLLSGGRATAGRLPLILLGAGWLLLVLALAGPAWQRLPQPLYQAQQVHVIALDLSPSMHAGDLKPSRLAHARYEVLDLLQRTGEGQTALIAYGAEPFVVSPLTTDTATIAAQVPLLDTGLLPVPGARRGDLALEQAGELLRQAGVPRGEVILVTDALEHPAATVEAARRLHAAGHRVSVLGVGTVKGAPIALPGGGFAKDAQGAIVLPRLDVDALAEVAAAGGGRYVTARLDDGDIAALLPPAAARRGIDAAQQDARSEQWREEGPWLLLLLLPLAALALRRGWLSPLVLWVLVLPAPDAGAVSWDALWLRADQQAQRRLEAGQAAAAAELFERLDWRAAAHYQAGDYAQALQALEGGDAGGAAYNRGNTLARLGRLEDAVTAYDQALAADPADADARFNRALVQGLLERQRAQAGQPPTQDPQTQDPQMQDPQTQDPQEAQADESAQRGTPAEQAEQGEPDERADQGGESSQGEQNASAQPAEQTGQGDPQPGEQDQGGASRGSERSQPGAAGTAQGRAGEAADDARAQDRQGAAGDRQGEERPGATGEGRQTDRPDAAGAPPDADAPQGPQGEPQQQAVDDPPDSGEPDAAADPQEGRPQSTEAPQGGDPERRDGDASLDGVADAAGQEAGSAGQDPTGPSGMGGGGAPLAAGPDEARGAEPEPGQAGAQDPTVDGARGTAAEADRQDPGARPDPSAAAPTAPRQAADAPPGRPGLADLMGGDAAQPQPARPAVQAADGGSEDRQALEQMLRRVEDDPGGLLRQRFLLQHLRRSGQLP